ncbi:sphingosine-1-phosphate phosphatase 1 isoform X6 [Rhipicephalus microplus]|uniref:sphingosine-1-phosphate phosphatase 1 isoform X6 n=1 Tax=Rhipicephalus microplus TaxID=6941 RepID=UPI003F6B64B3
MWDEPLKRCRSSALNSPFLVERVQNYFGVYRLSAPKNDSVPNGVQRNGYTSAAVVGHASVPCRVELPVWYYVFRFGSLLGYEAFYATFFPFILWNWDAVVCRRVLLVWALVMYCGGLTKDLLRWPRPASPPVVQLDRAYAAEFGMPSTHAMTGASVPFGLLLWTQQRYQYPFLVVLCVCIVWCTLLCVSRLYLGMHTMLDGALYAVEGPTLVGLAFIAARTVVGLLASVLVRTAVKAVIYPLLCSVHGCDPKLESSRQKGSIELPYKYITYLSMGLTMSLGSPWLFHLLGIQRESLPVHI